VLELVPEILKVQSFRSWASLNQIQHLPIQITRNKDFSNYFKPACLCKPESKKEQILPGSEGGGGEREGVEDIGEK
jgi:hypothetical protein